MLSEKCRGAERSIAGWKRAAGKSVLPECHSAKEYRFHDTPGDSRCGGWRCGRGGTTRPAIPDSDILPLIDNKIGKIIVKNDVFSVDGEIWMNGAACEEKTPEPVTLSDERKQSVQKNEVQIPGATANQIYESTGTAEYASYFQVGLQITQRYLTSTQSQSIHRWSAWECRQTGLRLISRLFRPNIKA